MLLGYEYLLGPIGNVSELDHEIKSFVSEYKKSSWWWLTTFVASVGSLTIGAQNHLLIDVAVLSIFFIPAVLFFHRYYPFSLKLEHRPTQPSDKGRESPDSDGNYAIDLITTVGTNVDQIQVDIKHPPGAKSESIQPPNNLDISLQNDKQTITGEVPPGRDSFVLNLIVSEVGSGVGPGGNMLVFIDKNSERELTSIRLLPS